MPAKAVDGSLATCWCKGTKGHGEGEWLHIELAKPFRVRAVRVYPGCGANDAVWFANNRIRELEVALGKAAAPAFLSDERRLQDLGFSSDLPVTSLRFTILGVHRDPAPKFDDTCLGEIQADLE